MENLPGCLKASITPDAPLAQHGERAVAALPSEGEALISIRTMAGAMAMSESFVWDLALKDPKFPKPLRLGPRCTRLKLSEARAYIAGLTSTDAKPSPNPAARSSAKVAA